MKNQLDRFGSFNDYAPGFFGFAPVFEKFFDDVLQESPRRVHSAAVLTPACDITETETHFLLSLDMPGVSRDDIKMEVVDSQLVVTAERHGERRDGQANRHVSERTYGRYQRAFALGKSVNPERIEAVYQDGVLNVALPKAEQAKPRTIKID